MFTGTLISDLMATVEQAELRVLQSAGHSCGHDAEQDQIDEELHAIFAMQIPVTLDGQLFMGAA
jgi:hypothetical protein